MNINIKTSLIELTPALRQYIEDKLTHVGKFLGGNEPAALAEVEIGKTTQHHKLGDYFRAEINLTTGGTSLRAEATEEDLYASIDIAKDNLVEEVKNLSDKKQSLLKRGGRALKNIIKGFYHQRR